MDKKVTLWRYIAEKLQTQPAHGKKLPLQCSRNQTHCETYIFQQYQDSSSLFVQSSSLTEYIHKLILTAQMNTIKRYIKRKEITFLTNYTWQCQGGSPIYSFMYNRFTWKGNCSRNLLFWEACFVAKGDGPKQKFTSDLPQRKVEQE